MQRISNEEYHAESEHISCSGVKMMLESPWKFKNNKRVESTAFAFGSMFHTLTLEYERFGHEFAISKKTDLRTKAGKAAHRIFQEENEGKIIVSEKDYEIALEMSKAARSTGLFDDGDSELSFFTELYGAKLKVRPDFLSRDRSTYVELKSCVDASVEGFSKAFYKYGYNIQDAMYYEVLSSIFPEFKNIIFVAVSKDLNVSVNLFSVTDRNESVQVVKIALHNFKTCTEFDIWPGTSIINEI